jgi:hypothetical protein
MDSMTRARISVERERASRVPLDRRVLDSLAWKRGGGDEHEFDRHVPLGRAWLDDDRLDRDVRRRGYLSRRDVFRLVGDLLSDWERVLVVVNAWGYGKRASYGPYRTAVVLAQSERFAAASSEAHRLLRAKGVEEAFYFLNNDGHVPGWGPAFFTKFLYFVGEPQTTQALILDARLAEAVHRIVPGSSFRSAGWTTPQYAFYVALMQRIAAMFEVTPDEAEATLFAHF